IWNQVDGREKSELYDVYEQIIAELGLSVLKTFIPNSLRFRRELLESHKALFRSTLFPVDKTLLKGSNLVELVEEVSGIINL
ncbi:MAG: ParA family protein, partial [Lentisphaerae bacterium]|nr:ParA family protein [Lentisphaerota bacterium]